MQGVTRGNVTEVKVVLASIVTVLAAYQVTLMAVGYGKLRLPFLSSRPASVAHRTIGDAIVVMTVIVAIMCLSYFGFGEDTSTHVVLAVSLLAVLALKIVVVRWWHGMSRLLPVLGSLLFGLFVATWLSAAAEYVV